MKNINLIPTDKPSKLSIIEGKLLLSKFVNWESKSIDWEEGDGVNQHIYITSEEEIKEGDWYLFKYQIIKCENPDLTKIPIVTKNYCKKIILTTDGDLIQDGVQAIDDTFLEWYIENPKCEWVEVDVFTRYIKSVYQIILPKPKALTKLEIAKNIASIGIGKKEEHKQKTFEKAAERYKSLKLPDDLYDGFIEGAKWQQQQNNKELAMWKLAVERQEARCKALHGVISDLQDTNKFSEEEAFELIKKAVYKKQNAWKVGELDEWFKQFKNK